MRGFLKWALRAALAVFGLAALAFLLAVFVSAKTVEAEMEEHR